MIGHAMADTDDAPKSAVELAMERLRKKDAEAGAADRALTDDQKAEIADIRTVYGAKIAQEEIMFKAKLQALFDPEERQKLDDNYRRDLQRLNDERDSKIAKVRARS
jgi:hypothetical protein